jgi:hypothetical protein
MLCGRPTFGLSSSELAALQTFRDAGVCRDPSVLGHRHGAMTGCFRVGFATPQSEPLRAAVSATQRFIGGYGLCLAPPILQRNNGTHGRR